MPGSRLRGVQSLRLIPKVSSFFANEFLRFSAFAAFWRPLESGDEFGRGSGLIYRGNPLTTSAIFTALFCTLRRGGQEDAMGF